MKTASKVAGVPGHDPTLPDVELVAGGKTHKLAFDFNAICVAEKETGANLLTSIVTDLSASSMRGLLYAAMLKEQPDVTLEYAGGLINVRNLAEVRSAIVTAWFGSISEASGKE